MYPHGSCLMQTFDLVSMSLHNVYCICIVYSLYNLACYLFTMRILENLINTHIHSLLDFPVFGPFVN